MQHEVYDNPDPNHSVHSLRCWEGGAIWVYTSDKEGTRARLDAHGIASRWLMSEWQSAWVPTMEDSAYALSGFARQHLQRLGIAEQFCNAYVPLENTAEREVVRTLCNARAAAIRTNDCIAWRQRHQEHRPVRGMDVLDIPDASLEEVAEALGLDLGAFVYSERGKQEESASKQPPRLPTPMHAYAVVHQHKPSGLWVSGREREMTLEFADGFLAELFARHVLPHLGFVHHVAVEDIPKKETKMAHTLVSLRYTAGLLGDRAEEIQGLAHQFGAGLPRLKARMLL